MSDPNLALWYAAVAVFGGGDYITTKAGLAAEGVEESNPVAAYMIDGVGPEVAMFTSKSVVLAVYMAGYLKAKSHPETEQYAPLFPALMLLHGLLIVQNNVQVLEKAGAL